MNLQPSVERQPRSRTLAELVGLLTELPAPIEISFEDDTLRLYLADGDDFERWAARHDASVMYRAVRHADTIQWHGYGQWRGWRLVLTVCQRVRDDLLTLDEAADVLAAVTDEPVRSDAALVVGELDAKAREAAEL